MRRPPIVLSALLAATIALAGCGEEKTGGESPDGQQIEGGSQLDSTWPLTGEPVGAGSSSALDHPVLVTKIDNTEASSPQVGLGSADLVVEELVEGGLTRLAVFFYSDIPGEVGPVRSMRASDIGIVSPVEGTVVTSGAAQVTIDRINGAGLTFYQEGAKGIFRDNARSAPYNLFADLGTIADTAASSATRPPDYLPWGSDKDLPNGKKATSISVSFGSHVSQWQYRNGQYVNTNSNAPADDQFSADSVLVLRVEIGDAGYTDPAGNPVPETKFVGSGDAQLFHAGEVVNGSWKKADLGSAISLSGPGGDLTVPAGHTWIELVPKKDGDVTY